MFEEVLSPIHIRHNLHSIAELSSKEKKTSDYITDVLQKLGVKKIHRHFSLHSILAELDSGVSGPTILFRCELDALPISENNDIPYISVNQGVSHKCGHDGHMATMISFAQKLILNPPPAGKILLFFQSAEEIGAGAKGAIESHIFDNYNIDFVFAWHNIPGYPKGQILVKDGLFTPCVESVVIRLIGKTSHAAEPENGINPASVIAEIIQYLENINQPNKSKEDFFLSTPIYILMGEQAYGTSAGNATLGFTFRAWHSSFFELQKSKIIQKIKSLSRSALLEIAISWVETFYANNNDTDAYHHIISAAEKNNYSLHDLQRPFEFGEDFGLFTQRYSGAMFGIGAGENHPALHSGDFDFDDDLIEIGSNMFMAIANNILKNPSSS